MRDGLKRRLLRTDTSGWNEPRYVPVGGGMLAILGVSLGTLFGAQFAITGLGEYVVTVLCLAITMAVGFVGLAILDMHEPRQ